MEPVGIRELKENLSRYMKKVQTGQRIIIKDRKKEIAVIMPIDKKDQAEKVYQLVQRGVGIWHGGKPEGMPDRILSRGKKVSDAIIEDRR